MSDQMWGPCGSCNGQGFRWVQKMDIPPTMVDGKPNTNQIVSTSSVPEPCSAGCVNGQVMGNNR